MFLWQLLALQQPVVGAAGLIALKSTAYRAHNNFGFQVQMLEADGNGNRFDGSGDSGSSWDKSLISVYKRSFHTSSRNISRTPKPGGGGASCGIRFSSSGSRVSGSDTKTSICENAVTASTSLVQMFRELRSRRRRRIIWALGSAAAACIIRL